MRFLRLMPWDSHRGVCDRRRCSELTTVGAGSENQADSIESCQVFHLFVVLPAAISCRAAVAFASAWLICFAAASSNQGQSIQYVWSYCARCGKLEGSPTWCAFIYSFSRQNRRDACFYHLLLTSWAEAGKVKLNFSTEPNYTNLSEVAELSSFCKSTSNNSTRLQRDPAKVFNCGGEVTSGGGVSVDICPLGCGTFRVWIQPTTEMIHSNICESGPSVPSLNGTRQDILRCYILRIWIMAVSVVAQIHTVMSANPSSWS